jgi:hypothetical protein
MSDSFSIRGEQHISETLGQMNLPSLEMAPRDVRRRLLREAREMGAQEHVRRRSQERQERQAHRARSRKRQQHVAPVYHGLRG